MANVQVTRVLNTFVSAAARTYGLHQLARRAGVSQNWFRGWHIEHEHDSTVVYPFAGRRQRIRFRHAGEEHWNAVRRGRFSAIRAAWPEMGAQHAPPVADFIVPFGETESGVPLFRTGDDEAECPIDLLASIVLTLSRYEETLPAQRDRHGRFPAAASLAAKHQFIMRPIVDEYGLAFQQVLRWLFPTWEPEVREFEVNLTHDVDEIGIPFRFRLAARRSARCGAATGLREIRAAFGAQPSALAAVLKTEELARERGLTCGVYWKASPAGEFDSGYDIRDRRITEVIGTLRKSGVELGVHPGYATFGNRERLENEVERLRTAFGSDAPLGGRQHFLRWSPRTWDDWESCGLQYDSSMGFSEYVGFRAGTCYPYRPWLLDQDREANLLEVPLIAMDCTLTDSLALRGEQCMEPLMQCMETCRQMGGVFTVLWHTDSILEPQYGNTYELLLDKLAGCSQFNWRRTMQEGNA